MRVKRCGKLIAEGPTHGFAVARELPQRPQYGASSAAGHQSGGDYLFEQRQLDSNSQ